MFCDISVEGCYSVLFFFLMILRPPRATRTDTLFPYTTLFRSREVEFSIPREMNQAQGVALAREFVEKQFVERGMVADLNVHWDMGKDGVPKPHAHVMLSMREVDGEGFGKKVRDWNRTELLEGWREAWANHVN